MLVDWDDVFTLAIRVDTDKTTRLKRLEIREQKNWVPELILAEIYMKFMNRATSYDDGGIDMRNTAKHGLLPKIDLSFDISR